MALQNTVVNALHYAEKDPKLYFLYWVQIIRLGSLELSEGNKNLHSSFKQFNPTIVEPHLHLLGISFQMPFISGSVVTKREAPLEQPSTKNT